MDWVNGVAACAGYAGVSVNFNLVRQPISPRSSEIKANRLIFSWYGALLLLLLESLCILTFDGWGNAGRSEVLYIFQ